MILEVFLRDNSPTDTSFGVPNQSGDTICGDEGYARIVAEEDNPPIYNKC